MPRPKQRTPELGERVLETALRIVAVDGVEALTARRVATEAGTSPAAIYELFGDKAGVVRAMFFSGFEQLAATLGAVPAEDDAVAELRALGVAYREFLVRHPALAALMFSRPIASFDPGPDEAAAGAASRRRLLGAVRRGVRDGDLHGDPTDIALAFMALVHGLAAGESGRLLGRSRVSVQRRWDVAIDALLAGFARAPAG